MSLIMTLWNLLAPLNEWKTAFLSNHQSSETVSKLEQKQLIQENKRLQKELNCKDKAFSETAALVVLSKKWQAIYWEKEVDYSPAQIVKNL